MKGHGQEQEPGTDYGQGNKGEKRAIAGDRNIGVRNTKHMYKLLNVTNRHMLDNIQMHETTI